MDLAQPHNSPRSCRWTQPQLMQVVPSGLMLMKVVPSGLMQVASGWKPLAGEFMTSIWQVYGLIVQSIDHLSLIFKKAVVAKFSSILWSCSDYMFIHLLSNKSYAAPYREGPYSAL